MSNQSLHRNLKAKYHDLFQLLVFCAHFSNGILSRDLKDACRIINFPEDWLAAVTYISLSSKPNFVDSENVLDEFKTNIKLLKEQGNSDFDILAQCRKSESITSNEILKMNDIKVGEKKEILFTVDPEIRNILEGIDLSGTVQFDQKVNILKYYSFLFESVMKLNKKKPYYWESVVECTLLNSNTEAWKCRNIGVMDSNSFLLNDDISVLEIQDIIRNHDINIRVLLNFNSTLSLNDGITYALKSKAIDSQGISVQEKFFQVFESFILYLCAICKIYEYYEIALEYVALFRQLNRTEASQERLFLCTIKLELFCCDIMYQRMKKSRDYCSTEEFTNLEVNFKVVENELKTCKGEEW